jgi:hypothetical protein
MTFNPLAPVTDYQSMLNRIFWFTSASALVAVWILRLNIPALNHLLHRIDFTVEFGGNKVLPIAGGYLLPAVAAGILTRVFRLHARISDWLGIRESFDIEVIIKEFATQLSINLTFVSEQQLIACRHGIMRKAFYPFVNGFDPAVDRQLILQALDAWSWFWVGIESTMVFVLAGLGVVSGGALGVGLQIIGGTLLMATIGLPGMRRQCQRYAVAQVRAILNDPTRATAVRTAFAELLDGDFAQRRAA